MSSVVKWLTSDMQGAPQITNNWGVLVSMLDACLINGFNTQNPSSVTRSGSTVTMTFSGGGHGFLQHQVIVVSGAVESEYNGEQRVTAVTGTTVTFTVAGTPTSPATGTIAVKTAALGFEKPFSGTNKAVYRSANLSSTRMYLRVDNSLDPVWDASYAKFGKVTIADAMSDVDTFTGSQAPYEPTDPTRNHIGTGSGSSAYNGWARWYYAKVRAENDTYTPAAGNRKWVLIGDDKGFYLSLGRDPSKPDDRSIYAFGDFASLDGSDAYNCILQSALFYGVASDNSNRYTESYNELFSDGKSDAIALKPASGVGGFVYLGGRTLGFSTDVKTSGYAVAPQIPSPSPSGTSLYAATYLVETASQSSSTVTDIRGQLRGAYWCLSRQPYSDMQIVFVGGQGYMTINYYHTNSGTTGQVLFKITGAWT